MIVHCRAERVYSLVLPLAFPELGELEASGEIRYSDGAQEVPGRLLDDGFRARFRALMDRIGGEAPPARVPSPAECRFCKVGPEHCPDRIEGADVGTVRVDIF